MDSGFDTDPQFEIIWMPDAEDREQDGDKATRATETSAEVGSSPDRHRGNYEFDSDSPPN